LKTGAGGVPGRRRVEEEEVNVLFGRLDLGLHVLISFPFVT
jgi:hypothetical protein